MTKWQNNKICITEWGLTPDTRVLLCMASVSHLERLPKWFRGILQEMQVRSLGGNIPWRRAWQPPPVFLPGEFHGQRSLVAYLGSIGSQRVGQDWSYWASAHKFLRTQADKRQINERILITFCSTVTRLEMSRDWQQVDWRIRSSAHSEERRGQAT